MSWELCAPGHMGAVLVFFWLAISFELMVAHYLFCIPGKVFQKLAAVEQLLG
jgi:hypothetical protein